MVKEFIYFEESSLTGLPQFHLHRDVEPTWFLVVIVKHSDQRTTLYLRKLLRSSKSFSSCGLYLPMFTAEIKKVISFHIY